VPQLLLHREVEKESKPVVVRLQGLLAFALLVFALKDLKLGEPLISGVSDFRATGFILVLNDWDVCVEGFEVCLLASRAAIASSRSSPTRSHGRVPSASEYRRK
jgi:hypothetical protein